MFQNHADKCAIPWFDKKLDAAAGAAATITKAAATDRFHVLDWVAWSYDSAPTGGGLTITIGGVTYLDIDITAAGPGMMRFDPPIYNPAETRNEAVVITLDGGGGSVQGKVNVRGR